MHPRSSTPVSKPWETPRWRLSIWYGLIIAMFALFGLRLFYLQVIRHGYYQRVALQGQFKEYEIPAERGIIEAYDGDQTVPLVLNETLYTLFADPKFIKDPAQASRDVASVIGGNAGDYEGKMKADSRYQVLAKKLPAEQKDKLDKLAIKGVGTREESYRTYPQGGLAAQVLGFVNDDSDGKYGIEQFLDSQLKGTPGQLKAITDVQGVPLVSNKDNVVTSPQAGDRITLTIDINMQRRLEDILKTGLEAAKSKSGGVVIMDPKTGAIKAMANYPSYNPGEFYKVEDPSVFNNSVVSSPLEVGSIMKPLTAAAALDTGAITPDWTYYDPGFVQIDDAKVTNIEEDGGAAVRSLQDILQLSLNTGATHILMQMGGGEINAKARTTWYDYMTKHYMFGSPTGVEQGYEDGGVIPDPLNGYGLNIQYANTAFGQGMTATPLQMAAAISSVVNGGTYYKPRLVDAITKPGSEKEYVKPVVERDHVVSESVSSTIRGLMDYVAVRNNPSSTRAGYNVGGKTGTAEIANPAGGYFTDKYNGMYVGFVGGTMPDYVICVRVNEPGIAGYAGAKAAGPIFASVSNMLLDNFTIRPVSQ